MMERNGVRLGYFRVPDGEDLFEGELADLPRGDPLDETVESYCLCDNESSNRCGRKAVSDTIPDSIEPLKHLRLGVPNAIVGRRRRRKRQIDQVPLRDDWRLYHTSYR